MQRSRMNSFSRCYSKGRGLKISYQKMTSHEMCSAPPTQLLTLIHYYFVHMPQLHVSAAAPVVESPHQPVCSPWSLPTYNVCIFIMVMVVLIFEKCVSLACCRFHVVSTKSVEKRDSENETGTQASGD